MWRSMEDVLRELKEEGILENDGKQENTENGLPPGFRFHPTDEELITFYLASKVFNTNTTSNTTTSSNCGGFSSNPTNLFLCNSGDQIIEVDLTRCEPWDLPERARMGEKEWYMYSLRDRKYPSGLRTNRATETGYWKATGKDKQVYASGVATSGGGAGGVLIGMKKTLVFYQGRAPRGAKTKWVMHEYRLDGHFSSFRLSSKEEWVICRVFQKNNNGSEKKSTTHIMQPPPLSPPPLSPFLSSLPPLQELNTTATTTNTDSATQALADTSSQLPPYYTNHYPNSLLHSLLLNPLPNFSSISGSDTIFPTLNTTTATAVTTAADIIPSSTTLFPSLSTTTVAASAAAATKQLQQQQQHWLDRICPQIQAQYLQQQSHDQPALLFYDQMMMKSHHDLPNINPYTNDATGDNHDNDDDDDDVDVDTGVVHHVDMSPSFAVTALGMDRMLNNTINHHLPEYWSFHP